MAGFGKQIDESKDKLVLKVLGAKTIPNPLFTEVELAECYEGLYGFLINDYDCSRLHKGHARNNWEILEFQSSWHVLSEFYWKSFIEGLSESDRLAAYESVLATRNHLFPNLYQQRVKAKEKLEELLLL